MGTIFFTDIRMNYEWSDLINILVAWLTSEADKGALYVAITLVGTAAILFFSITLIPFQQYALQYTPSLFRYIRTDPRLVTGYITFLVLILIELSIYFFRTTHFTVVVAFSGVFFSFLLIGYLWKWSTRLLNPADQIVPRIRKRGFHEVNRAFKQLQSRVKSPEEKVAELKEMMQQTINTGEKIDPDSEQFEVPRRYTEKVWPEVRLLKELSMSFIKANQTDMFEASWQSIVDITKEYLLKRRAYINHLDAFVLDLSDEIRDLVAMARPTANLHFFRITWRGIEEASIATLENQVVGSKNGWHFLCSPLVAVLKENIVRDIALAKIDSAHEAVRSLGNIGIQMAQKGYTQSAAGIAEDLGNYVILSTTASQPAVPYLAKQLLAEVFFQSVNSRVLFLNYDYPFRKMVQSYDKIYSSSASESSLGVNDPVVWYDADLLKDRSLSTLVRGALFPLNDDDSVIEYNLDVVRELIDLIKKHYLKSSLQTSFTSQSYQIVLWLIAFIDKEITLEFLLYWQAVTIPTSKTRDKAVNLLFYILDWFSEIFVRSYTDKTNLIFERREMLENLLSSYYLLIYFDGKHNLGLAKILDQQLNKNLISIRGRAAQINLSDEEWVSLKLFADYLDRIKSFPQVTRTLRGYLRLARRRFAQGYRVLDHIKRPIVTFRQDVFTAFDKEIF